MRLVGVSFLSPPEILPRRIRSWTIALGLGLAMSHAGQAATVNVSLDRDVIPLGDSATLKITIDGGTGNEAPRIPSVAGLQFTAAGRTRGREIINGQLRSYGEVNFLVTGTRLGEFQIGPVTVPFGNQTLRSETLKVTIVGPNDPAASRGDGLENAAFLVLNLPKRQVYVGEVFVAEIWLYAIGGRVVQAPQLQADGFTLGKLTEGGQDQNIRTNNRIYSRVRFLQPLTAVRAGDLTIQAMNCALDIPVGRRTGFSDIFDDVFSGFREPRRLNLATLPGPIKVLPLPSDQVPPTFNGAVGEFDLQLTATPTNVSAGDPITVRVAIRGRGNFDAVQLPEQPAWAGFRVYPPTATFETQDPLGLDGTKQIEQVVTPEAGGVTGLPPLAFTYFSPEARRYRTLRSAPVPLQVAAGASTPNLPAPADGPSVPKARTPEIAPLKPHLGVLAAGAVPLANQPWYIILAISPWFLWIGTRVWRLQHARLQADPQRRRLRALDKSIDHGLAALARHGQQGDMADYFATLFRVLQEIVGAEVGQPPASITEGLLDTDLPARGIPEEIIAALHRLFQACNQARYAQSGGRADLEGLRAETAQIRDVMRRRRS